MVQLPNPVWLRLQHGTLQGLPPPILGGHRQGAVVAPWRTRPMLLPPPPFNILTTQKHKRACTQCLGEWGIVCHTHLRLRRSISRVFFSMSSLRRLISSSYFSIVWA